MKKKQVITILCIFVSAILSAQGVKQLWTTTWQDTTSIARGYVVSFNAEGNNFQTRHQISRPYPIFPESLNFFNGKFYSIVGEGGQIIEYDPVLNLDTVVGQLDGMDISVPVKNAMTLEGQMFYGISTHFVQEPEWGYLFQWDPVQHIFSRKYDFTGQLPSGALTAKGGLLYGMTFGPANDGGIFEWNPCTNTFTWKVLFPGEDKGRPTGSMVLVGCKFYGVCSGSSDIAFYGNPPASDSLTGALFEWDPATNDFVIKYDFDNAADGANPIGNLIEKDGKLYGVTYAGGANNEGVLFEFDPSSANNGYTKKADLTNLGNGSGRLLALSGGNLYGFKNRFLFEWNAYTGQVTPKQEMVSGISDLLVLPALVSSPLAGNCKDYPSIAVDHSNNNQWLSIVDSAGGVLAEVQPHGNNLGTLSVGAYVNNGEVRTDGMGRPYLNRNITITPSLQPVPGNPVDIRLYITNRELDLLKAHPNSGITGISDVAIFKSAYPCSPNVTNASPVPTAYEEYPFGWILTSTISSFSTFYFSNRNFEALPLQMLSFSGKLQSNNVLLQWTTDHENNAFGFDMERSTDGDHFVFIASVSANNTSGIHEYTFDDEKVTMLSTHNLYYRLKQKDLDGRYKYSNTISINLPLAPSLILSPNPAQTYLDIHYNKQNGINKAVFQIVDMSGKKLQEQTFMSHPYSYRINIEGLSGGVYFVIIKDGNKKMVAQFVKQ